MILKIIYGYDVLETPTNKKRKKKPMKVHAKVNLENIMLRFELKVKLQKHFKIDFFHK